MTIMGILTVLLVFTVLVVFHELGHFLAAKLFKMRVEEFAVGFGKRLFRVAFDGETEYNIRALPLGGFVRIAGMEIEDAAERRLTGATKMPAATDAHDGLETTNTRLIEQEEAEVSGAVKDGFNNRPIYQRFGVIAAGPLFSFLLGWLVLCIVGFTSGIPDKIRFQVGEVKPASVAQAAGLHAGDEFMQINHKPLEFEDVLDTIHNSAGKPLTITVADADGKTRDVVVTPRAETIEGKTVGLIGVVPGGRVLTTKRLGVGESITRGSMATAGWFLQMASLIKSGAIKDNVGGTVAIFKQTQQAARHGATETLTLMGNLSLSLGFFNLLPIPVLDGGHLTLMGIEAVRRRKLTAEQTSRVFTAGLAVLAALFMFALFKDLGIANLFHHG